MLEYLVAFAAIFLATLLWTKSRPRNFPPGPLALPMIGNVYNISLETFEESMGQLHEKHGPILSLSLVGHGIWDIWLGNLDLIKEVLHDPRFTDRTPSSIMDYLDFEKGIGFCSGGLAKRKRKVILQTMRMLGVGRSVFSTGVEEQTQVMLTHLESLGDENIYIQGVLSYATNNIISKLLFNTSFSYDDKDFMRMHYDLMRMFYLFNPTRLISLLPIWISKHMPETKELVSLFHMFQTFVKESFDKRNPQKGLWTEPECMSDYIWKQLTSGETEFPFPVDQITHVLSALFVAGQETTATTLSWALLNLLHCPWVQEKVYEELQREFPNRDEIITLSAIQACPYTVATINEVQRFTPVTISTINHTASEDIVNFHGFSIPKGTRMMPTLTLMNYDKNIWKYPKQFNPENFLDDKGKFVKSQYLMPFGVGTRACPGENIAKMELYVVFANLMRKFKVCPTEDSVPALIPNVGVVSSPPHYEVRLLKRVK